MSQPSSDAATRFATVVLVGRPNAGKSSLLNALVGQRLAIVSAKPQSTRTPVTGIWTEGDTQLAFIDPPGLLEPSYLLQTAMLEAAHDAVSTADLALYLHPATDGPPPDVAGLLPEGLRLPPHVLTLLTKCDLAAHAPPAGDRVRPVSAETREGLTEVLAWCRRHAPVAPFRYDPDDASTQPVRFFVAELVREAAFELLSDELPYALAVEVDEFREGSKPVYIRMTLHVERASQKHIVIGEGGRQIKALGQRARAGVEALLGEPVYLDLWVKALPKWRSSPAALTRLGFPLSRARRR